MHPLPAFAMMLALAVPLAVAAGQPLEASLGYGIGVPDRATGTAVADARSQGSLRPHGVRLEFGGVRGGGNGIRISRMADNAFGLSSGEPVRRIGQAVEVGATERP